MGCPTCTANARLTFSAPIESKDGSLNFLVTNDDGIDSPGINALVDACASLGDVCVVAPTEEQSGVGHKLTTNRPISYQEIRPRKYAVAGTPADCVRIAVLCLQTDVDWVLSGINIGANFGVDLYSSGTVAAAREAAILGYPALAISQYYLDGVQIDWNTSAERATRSIARLINPKLLPGQFWNLNLSCTSVEGVDIESRPVICPADPSGSAFDIEHRSDSVTLWSNIHERRCRPNYDIAQCLAGLDTASRITI